MHNFLLAVPHPLLCSLNFLLEEDDFTLNFVSADETRYTRVHCDWTCRVRAILVAMDQRPTRGRRTGGSRSTPFEYLALQIELQREGISRAISGQVVRPARDWLGLYLRNVRALVHFFPLALNRAKVLDIPASDESWRATPFVSAQVLNYLAHVRWQGGQLEEAAACYEALLPYAVRIGETPVVLQRLEELKSGSNYDERGAERPQHIVR